MNKKLITISIVLALLISGFIIFNQNSTINAANNPISLKIYLGPSSVLANSSTYNSIFVQLQDSTGQPFRALQDTTISLSSSLTNIGTVDPSITILKGTTYASGNFHTTFTPGTTTISASATGYATVQAVLTTVGPIPSAIGVYGFPSTLPADGSTYNAIMVQLQDSTGSPAIAPDGGVQVTLSCSNINVGTVDSTATIPQGQTYAIATFNTTTTAGSATVTAVASGYASNQATITTQKLGSTPYQVKIFVGPPKIMANENSYQQLAVELQDSTGNIAAAPSNLTITLASSDQSIGTSNSQITINQSQTYALATVTTTYKAGTTTITAVGTNLQRDQESITTTGFVPSQLAVYCVPSILPSDNATYQAVVVQLQDSQGRPAIDPESNVIVNLFSSQPTVGSVTSTLTIPFGSTQATGDLTVTNTPGSTTITAQAPGYTTSQAKITTYLIDYSTLTITLSSNPQSVTSGNTTQITAYVNVNGNPITGATVTCASDNGGSFSTTTEHGNGYYSINFTAPSFSQSTTCTITASASKTGYLSSQSTATITVLPTPVVTPTPTPTIAPTPTPTPTPTPSGSNSSVGTLTLRVLDNKDNPLSGTLVSSETPSLADVTNSTGYVTFQNVTAGSITFKIIANGYPETNETVPFSGPSLVMDITLVAGTAAKSDSTSVALILIAVVAIAAVGATGFLLISRGSRSKAKKIRELQKQLNPKP